MDHGFIHISKAVKKYGKTRQTFYNYLHKGHIRSKKVNNRIYLNISDIEQLLSDYIDTADTTTTNEIVEEIYEDMTTQKQVVEKTIDQQSEYFESLVEKQKQSFNQAIQSTQYMTNTLQFSVESILQRMHTSSQKSRFLITMLFIALVHSIILFFLV